MVDILNKLYDYCGQEKNHKGMSMHDTYKAFKPWFDKLKSGDEEMVEHLHGIRDYGLSEEEAFFILAYTGSHSSWINKRLRDGGILDTDCKKFFATILDYTLDKIPSFSNKTVYRMDSPDYGVEILKWFEKMINKNFRIPYFLSTAQEDYNNNSIVWIIDTLSTNSMGKDISGIANNPLEKEILFMRNSKFCIDSVDQEKSHIYLHEIDEKVETDFDLTGLYHRNIK